jgi:adenine-specific DNA-methyltransferase
MVHLPNISAIRSKLGKPFFEAQNCLIYNRDCVEGFKNITDSSIDLTITSPPYNIGKEYENSMTKEQYIEWCSVWLSEIGRLTTASGAFWLNLGYFSISEKAKAIPISYLLWDKVPMYLIQEVVWNYGAGVAGKLFFSPRNEKFLWYVNDPENYTFNLDEIRDPNVKYPNQKKNGKIKVNPLGKNPTDVWQFPKVTSGTDRSSAERTAHPAQFPVAVIDRILLASSNPGDLILDPFMGSGTTAAISLRRKRSVIGFEIRKDYCQIIADRIENGLSKSEEKNLQPLLINRSSPSEAKQLPFF